MELLTAKMQPKDIAALKKTFIRPGFVEQWDQLEAEAKEFAKVFTGKETATPSATWKLLTSYQPEAILWLAHTGKGAAIQNKFKNFFTVWPEARQKVPVALMQEMRITPEIERYDELLRELFFQLIDGKLQTEEEMRAFLEPYSPPAPPPPVTIRRSRKKAAEPKIKTEKLADEDEDVEDLPNVDDLDLDAEDLDEEEDDEEEDAPVKPIARTKTAPVASLKKEDEKKPAPAAKHAPAAKAAPEPKPAKKEAAKPAAKSVPAKPAHPAKKAASKLAPVKSAPAKSVKKAAPAVKKHAAKPVHKPVVKKASKPAAKPAPKKAAHKPAKPVKKPAKKR
jgi:hypothetical protein